MSALKDLVMGQGCAVEAGPSGANPLAKLFSGIIESSRKPEQLGDVASANVPISAESKQKIANRARVVTRHLYPGIIYVTTVFSAPSSGSQSRQEALLQSTHFLGTSKTMLTYCGRSQMPAKISWRSKYRA